MTKAAIKLQQETDRQKAREQHRLLGLYNPITRKHKPLLDLLTRVGFVFSRYKQGNNNPDLVSYGHNQDPSILLVVQNDGFWGYDDDTLTEHIECQVTNESELNEFLEGTLAANYLRMYKLKSLVKTLVN